MKNINITGIQRRFLAPNVTGTCTASVHPSQASTDTAESFQNFSFTLPFLKADTHTACDREQSEAQSRISPFMYPLADFSLLHFLQREEEKKRGGFGADFK